jgi:serine-type D-Ala-D-Ala carboxypeptidase/endopeptidase (penicillin-binding protein 4)
VGVALAILASACATRSHPASPADPSLSAQSASSAASHRILTSDIDRILADDMLAHGTWGVAVRSLRTHETLYAHNPQKLLMPASNMKIVTLAAAGARLGWDFTFQTTLFASGRVDAGTLNGDLIVVGSGDPSLMAGDGSADRVFNEWADRLRQLGVQTISGRIIGDDNAFDDQTLGFGWSWDDLPDDYAAGIGALQYNENAVRVTVAPGTAAGDQASVTVEPPGAGILVVNSIRTAAAATATSITTRRLPGRERLELGGTIPAGAATVALTVSVDNPTLFFVQALRRALIAQGLDVRGNAVDIDDVPGGTDLRRQTEVASHRSAPLSTLAIRLMKASQNQYAETLLKSLAVDQSTTSQATAASGRIAAQKLLETWGVDASTLILRDGSGLSRYDYVTADALATILVHLYDDEKARAPFMASLPIAGEDGTLGNRMKGTVADGNVHAKTGSMSNVRGLSGYVNSADGEPLAFAILANNFDSSPEIVSRVIDTIVIRLANFRR